MEVRHETEGDGILADFHTVVNLQACGIARPTTSNNNEWLDSSVPATSTAIALGPTVTNTPAPTSTMTQTSTPVPPSLKVVYSRDGSIWIWNEGGQPKRLTFGSVDERPRISADGNLVVFKRGNELWAVNADGLNLYLLVSDEFLKRYRPRDTDANWPELYAWSPNSHTLYFTTMAHAALYGVTFPDSFYWDVFRGRFGFGRSQADLAEKTRWGPLYFTRRKLDRRGPTRRDLNYQPGWDNIAERVGV